MDYEKYKAEFIAYIAFTVKMEARKYFKKELEVKTKEIPLSEEESELTNIENKNNVFKMDQKDDEIKKILYKESISALTERQREVLELTDEGYSDSEIGERLDITASTVRATRKQAIEKCKKYIDDGSE